MKTTVPYGIWLFGGAKYQGQDKAEARSSDEQPLSDKPPIIRCREIYKLPTGSSNIKLQQKVLC